MVGANSAGVEVESGFGTLVKVPAYVDDLTQWTCQGHGIKNDSGQDVFFSDFDCIVVDSAGTRHRAVKSWAKLTSNGAETMSCSYNSAATRHTLRKMQSIY